MILFFVITIIVSVTAQIIFGCVNVDIFSFPINLILLAIIVYIAFAENRYFCAKKLPSKLSSKKMSLLVIASMIFVALVIGFIPQYSDTELAYKTTFLNRLGIYSFTRSWIYIAVFFWFLLVLAGVIVRRALIKINARNVFFMLNHAGLWLALAAAFFGDCDTEEMKMMILKDKPSNIVYTFDGKMREISYFIQLKNFEVEYYENGVPSGFKAIITIIEDKKMTEAQIEVNSPFSYKGSDIYLSSYDVEAGDKTQFCIIQIVRQPWKFAIYIGILMMIVGSVCLFVKKQ